MNNYFSFYILSYFNKNKKTSVSQLIHILQGKRTPSMLYLIELNHWHHGFAKFSNSNKDALMKILTYFIQVKWIFKIDDGYVMTDLGEHRKNEYFGTHYYPSHINHFTNMNLRLPFWNRFQLFTQVLSEKSYQNNQYAPIIKHPHHQENVRLLFQQFTNQQDFLLQEWIKEQYILFNLMEEERVDYLVSHLTGHQLIGKTYNQVREERTMYDLEYEFYHLDTLELFIQLVRINKEKTPLINAMIEQLHKETNYGLSASTHHTYNLLKEGHTVKEISVLRDLKENTIREHVLEMAFILEAFPFKFFVPETVRKLLIKGMETGEVLSYKDARSLEPDMEFMHYRLVELERMRGRDR